MLRSNIQNLLKLTITPLLICIIIYYYQSNNYLFIISNENQNISVKEFNLIKENLLSDLTKRQSRILNKIEYKNGFDSYFLKRIDHSSSLYQKIEYFKTKSFFFGSTNNREVFENEIFLIFKKIIDQNIIELAKSLNNLIDEELLILNTSKKELEKKLKILNLQEEFINKQKLDVTVEYKIENELEKISNEEKLITTEDLIYKLNNYKKINLLAKSSNEIDEYKKFFNTTYAKYSLESESLNINIKNYTRSIHNNLNKNLDVQSYEQAISQNKLLLLLIISFLSLFLLQVIIYLLLRNNGFIIFSKIKKN